MKIKLLKKPKLKSKLMANKKTFEKILISLIVIAMVGGTFFYVFQTRNLEETVLGGLLTGLISDYAQQEEQKDKEIITEISDYYKETAQPGEGLTHLARRALSHYIEENEINDLTVEHKIYIEDYIQKELGSEPLSLNQEVSVSHDLISEAVDSSRNLTDQQLNNLKQYSVLVSSL